MNVIFVSPNFPSTYWNFCDRLRRNGVNVLGIGDAPYDGLAPELRDSLTEYYRVGTLSSYDEVFRATAFFSYKYGKIDWIESMNEYWLEQDARLRTDFNVSTGIQNDQIDFIKEKSLMKKKYLAAGIPTARQFVVSGYGSLDGGEAVLMNPDGTAADGTPLVRTTLADAKDFIDAVGYPVIVKPNVGVGATNTWKLETDEDLERFYAELPAVPYVMEEFIEGDIVSYDAITDSRCDPLFESMTVWPPSVMDLVLHDLDLMYYTCPEVPERLRELGRQTVKTFGVKSRFVHLEFFRLTRRSGGFRRAGGQHAPGGRLHAGHDELRALHGRLPDLGGHGHHRPPLPRRQAADLGGARRAHDGERRRPLLRVREQERRTSLRAPPRGGHGALRLGARDAGGDARDELAADGPLHVHGPPGHTGRGRPVCELHPDAGRGVILELVARLDGTPGHTAYRT